MEQTDDKLQKGTDDYDVSIKNEGKQTFLTETDLANDNLEVEKTAFENVVAGVDDESQATLLLKKQQDLRIVDDALEYMKQEYRTRMTDVRQKEEKLLVDKQEMEAMIERFRDFIADNDAKRNRAEMKAQAEADARTKLDAEKTALQNHYHQLQTERENLENELARLRKYYAYLEKCVASSKEEFPEANALVGRYETLKKTNESLHEQNKRAQTDSDKQRQQVANMQTETQNKVLSLSSQYQEQQKHLEELIVERGELESRAESHECESRESTAASGLVARALQNMYARCVSTAGKHAMMHSRSINQQDKTTGLLARVDAIETRLLDLMRIVNDYPRWKAENEASVKFTSNSTVDSRGDISKRRTSLPPRHSSVAWDSRVGAVQSMPSGFVPSPNHTTSSGTFQLSSNNKTNYSNNGGQRSGIGSTDNRIQHGRRQGQLHRPTLRNKTNLSSLNRKEASIPTNNGALETSRSTDTRANDANNSGQNQPLRSSSSSNSIQGTPSRTGVQNGANRPTEDGKPNQPNVFRVKIGAAPPAGHPANQFPDNSIRRASGTL